jgi:hypothetical protein
MKVLFLDFDGVINSIRSAVAFGGYPWNIQTESLKLFDPVGVALIKKVCDKTGCKIVLSSTWRKQFTCKELSKAIDLPIIDATPILHKERGYEVQAWLDTHKPKVYAIIDDDGDILESQLPFFVQTNSQNGITFADYVQLLKILGE